MDMKDIAELTNIQGRKLEKRKEQIKYFDAGDVEPEKENIDSDASRKRKSSEMEADRQMSAKMGKSINETNQQFDARRVEPEKEKNPQHENVDEEYVDKYAFNGKLFSRLYKHRGSNDILKVGQQYKSKIRETVQEHINHGIRFYIVYKVELEEYHDGEEESTFVYLHGGNRRLLHMEEYDQENYTGEGSGWVLD